MRYFLEVSYDGAAFHGYQFQETGPTVQAAVDDALQKLLRHPVTTVPAGRTDTGVHAEQQFIHFDTDRPIDPQFLLKINGILQQEIGVRALHQCLWADMSARFSVQRRTYRYRILLGKEPLRRPYAWWLRHAMSLDDLNAASATLLRYSDFKTFSKLGNQKTTICTIHEARWEQQGDELHFYLTGNRFLRGMVRLLVGTLVQVGQGRMTVEDFERRLAAADRRLSMSSAPAQGLALYRVTYPEGSLLRIQQLGPGRADLEAFRTE